MWRSEASQWAKYAGEGGGRGLFERWAWAVSGRAGWEGRARRVLRVLGRWRRVVTAGRCATMR